MEKNYVVLTDRTQVGDIIRSPSFAYGTYHSHFNSSRHLVPDYSLVDIIVKSNPTRVQYKNPDRDDFKDMLTVDLDAYESSRGVALFEVVTARFQGGGTAQRADQYMNGWYVEARRVDQPDETITFYQSKDYINNVPLVELVERNGRKPADIVRENL